MSFPRGYQVVIASSRRLRGNPEKIIKKFCKSEFLTGLLRQNLQFFLAMTTWYPRGNDIKRGITDKINQNS